jgi:hypothetical protein
MTIKVTIRSVLLHVPILLFTSAPAQNKKVPMGKAFIDFQIAKLVPIKKVVWKVTDSYIHWLKDQKEWNGTEQLFDRANNSSTTHIANDA